MPPRRKRVKQGFFGLTIAFAKISIFEVGRGAKSMEDGREPSLDALIAEILPVDSTQDFHDFTGSAKV